MTDVAPSDSIPTRPSTQPSTEPRVPPGQEPEAQPGHPMPGERRHEHLRNYPPVSDWDHHVEYDAKAHPRKVPHSYMLIPTTGFNCEAACG